MQLTEGARSAPSGADLAHIDTWIFDLDNTLYPSSSRLFDQVSHRIGAFIATALDVDHVEAKRLQKSYFREYGTTLRGLMLKHGMDPRPFSNSCTTSISRPSRRAMPWRRRSAGCPAASWSSPTPMRPMPSGVMARLGIGHHFSEIYDIEAADWVRSPFPKPMSGSRTYTMSSPRAPSCSRISCATWRPLLRSAWPPLGAQRQ